jgi:hypothetical protein
LGGTSFGEVREQNQNEIMKVKEIYCVGRRRKDVGNKKEH